MLQIKPSHCECVAGTENVQGKDLLKTVSLLPYVSYLFNPSKRDGSRRVKHQIWDRSAEVKEQELAFL